MKNLGIATLFFAFCLFMNPAQAQWDYGQHAIDNIIESRIDARKTRARIKARRGGKIKAGKSAKNKQSGRLVSTAGKPATALPSKIEFHRDTYQNFHLDDSKGYVVNFIFTSNSGKVFRRAHTYTYYNSNSDFKDLPIGKYKVTAECVYSGKKYPVRLGSDDGDTLNPLGGNFAPSMSIEIKPGKNQWGEKVLLTTPESLHVRVIE